MRFLVSLIIATFALTGAAFADPFANFYGNTVSIENPAGTRTVHINQDGTYTNTGADGAAATGTWAMDGENACFTQAASENPPYCVPATERAVGDTWELAAPDGTKEVATLVAGQ
ncbi:MAG: hypothetical protein RLN89_01650 [Parvibaculum sp.]